MVRVGNLSVVGTVCGTQQVYGLEYVSATMIGVTGVWVRKIDSLDLPIVNTTHS